MKVSDFLQHGAENAISAAALCSIAGTTPRGLRHAIALERAAGGEILYTPGGHGGYFLPSLDAEQAQRERLAFYRVMKAPSARSKPCGLWRDLWASRRGSLRLI